MTSSQLKGLQTKLSALETRVASLSSGVPVSKPVAAPSNNAAVEALSAKVDSLAAELAKFQEDLKRHCVETRQIVNNSIQSVKDCCKCSELEARLASVECMCKDGCCDEEGAEEVADEGDAMPKKKGKKGKKINI